RGTGATGTGGTGSGTTSGGTGGSTGGTGGAGGTGGTGTGTGGTGTGTGGTGAGGSTGTSGGGTSGSRSAVLDFNNAMTIQLGPFSFSIVSEGELSESFNRTLDDLLSDFDSGNPTLVLTTAGAPHGLVRGHISRAGPPH